jgi:hypothetical protein
VVDTMSRIAITNDEVANCGEARVVADHIQQVVQ